MISNDLACRTALTKLSQDDNAGQRCERPMFGVIRYPIVAWVLPVTLRSHLQLTKCTCKGTVSNPIQLMSHPGGTASANADTCIGSSSNHKPLTHEELRARRIAALTTTARKGETAGSGVLSTVASSCTTNHSSAVIDMTGICSSDDERSLEERTDRHALPVDEFWHDQHRKRTRAAAATIPSKTNRDSNIKKRPPLQASDFGMARFRPSSSFDLMPIGPPHHRTDPMGQGSTPAKRSRRNTQSDTTEKATSQSTLTTNGSNRQTTPGVGKSTNKEIAAYSSGSAPSIMFRVATYNLWFQPIYMRERMNAIADLLLQSVHSPERIQLMAFQENIVALDQILMKRLQSVGYRIFRQNNGAEYGCAIAIHATVTVLEQGWNDYRRSDMGRGILWVRAQLHCNADPKPATVPNSDPSTQSTRSPYEVLFTTTHLESYLDSVRNGSIVRQEQILELEQFCRQKMQQHPYIGTSIITGDLNWDDVRSRSQGTEPVLLDHLRSQDWRDAWLQLYGSKPISKSSSSSSSSSSSNINTTIGYTYDAQTNPMLGGNLRRRFDRILVCGDSRIQDAKLIGQEAIPGLKWTKTNPYNSSVKTVLVTPSDHYGLVVTFGSS